MIKATLKAASISALLVAPLICLELRLSNSNFPYALFATLWLLPTAFIITARSTRSPVIRTVFLALLAAAWIGIINDQLPCFLGTPNCD